MTVIEKVQGDAILQLFKEVLEDKIPLQIKLSNGRYPHLSHLKKIRKRLKSHYFLIEYDQDFLKATEDLDDWCMNIEFIAKDGIKYAFKTSDSHVSRGLIWIRFPKSIQRYQRRSLYRLEASAGTKLYFNINKNRYKLYVVNVSLGGTLGVVVSLTNNMEQELRLIDSGVLENVELEFPSSDDEDDTPRINIKQCQIIRQERNPKTKKYECAIEFRRISVREEKKLTEQFYRWQRFYLRKRKLSKSKKR